MKPQESSDALKALGEEAAPTLHALRSYMAVGLGTFDEVGLVCHMHFIQAA